MLWKKKVSGAILKQMGKIKWEEMINDRKIILKLVEIKEQFVLMEVFSVGANCFFYTLFQWAPDTRYIMEATVKKIIFAKIRNRMSCFAPVSTEYMKR